MKSQESIQEVLEQLGEAKRLLGEAHQLTARATALLADVHAEFGALVEEHAPKCPACSKRMLLHSLPAPFWGCPSWKAHKARKEKCTMDYAKWLASLAEGSG